MNWIDCKQEMPPPRARVICFVRNGMIRILSYIPFHKGVTGRHVVQSEWHSDPVNSLIRGFKETEVTHWMPLPDLPSNNGQD